MNNLVQKAREAVQWWMLCEECIENSNAPCQNCERLLDALIAAVREELHEEYAFAVLSASTLSAVRTNCERVVMKHRGQDMTEKENSLTTIKEVNKNGN